MAAPAQKERAGPCANGPAPRGWSESYLKLRRRSRAAEGSVVGHHPLAVHAHAVAVHLRLDGEGGSQHQGGAQGQGENPFHLDLLSRRRSIAAPSYPESQLRAPPAGSPQGTARNL